MRTVVKCDGTTQTDEAAEKAKAFERPMWDLGSKYQTTQNLSDHDSSFPADLPEDLAGLQIEGDLQCDINQVLGASFDPSVSRPMWGWAWNNTTEHGTFDDSSYHTTLTQSPFHLKMDMSEM
jgi:hypothetical protein